MSNETPIDTPLPNAECIQLYDWYEVRDRDGELMATLPLWAALLYLRLEHSQVRRRLIPVERPSCVLPTIVTYPDVGTRTPMVGVR